MRKTRMSTERPSLKGARAYLQYGDIQEIAEEVGCAKKTVENTINGRGCNMRVVEAVLARAEKNKELKERAAKF